MGGWLRRFFAAEEGQDLVEYSFLLVFIVLAAACFLSYNRDAVAGVAATTNHNLSVANTAASEGAGH